MATMSPIFPFPEPHHYSDYGFGFDLQIDYQQFIEESRRNTKRPTDSVHFKLSKQISKDNDRAKSKKKRKQWWKSALGFLKRSRGGGREGTCHDAVAAAASASKGYFCQYRAVAGPVYVTESVSGATTPCRANGSLSASVPYVCLRDLNVTEGEQIAFSMPIYLVT